jgi:non-heme chloroperoxidase
MKNILFWTLCAIIALIVLVHIALRIQQYTIQNNPEPYSYSTLSQEPLGEVAYIRTSDSTMLYTISAGIDTGKTIVLAHGFAGATRDWNLIFDQLVKEGYHVIAFDQRGHKKSNIGTKGVNTTIMAEDYKRILEYYDVKNAVLVGHSMGGFLSIAFLLKHPEVAKERIKGALLLSTFAGDVGRDNFQNSMQIPMIKKGWMHTILNQYLTAGAFCRTLIGDKPYKSLVDATIDDFTTQRFEPVLPILQAFVAENYYPYLKEITIPCTIMVGEKDKTTPPFHSIDLSKGISNATLIKVAGKGHLMNWEAPNDVVAAIKTLANKPDILKVSVAPLPIPVKTTPKKRKLPYIKFSK